MNAFVLSPRANRILKAGTEDSSSSNNSYALNQRTGVSLNELNQTGKQDPIISANST